MLILKLEYSEKIKMNHEALMWLLNALLITEKNHNWINKIRNVLKHAAETNN